jgi:hypothetical protein
MLKLVGSALLAARCSALAEQPDPVTLQRGQVSVEGAMKEEMSAMSQSEAEFEAAMQAQVGECQKVEGKHTSGQADTRMFNRPWTNDMTKLRDGRQWGMRPGSKYSDVMPEPGKDVKMAFLIFANDRIDNEEIWSHWMQEAQKKDLGFQVLVHAYGLPPRGNSKWQTASFEKYVMSDQARTTWCQMFEAQLLLVERALMDPHVTHLVMLSSDSVPVKPMEYIYNKTQSYPLSRFCVDDFWREPWPRAETWSMLRRADAQFFVENKDFAQNHLKRDCEEETAWYFPLRVRWDNFKDRSAIKRECIMFSNWKDGEKACKEAWAENAAKCNCPTLRQKHAQTPAGFKHPVTYDKVSAAAFEELLRSPFWFARKFTETGVPKELKTMLNMNMTQPKQAAPKRKRFGIFR